MCTLLQQLDHVFYSCDVSRCILHRGRSPPWHHSSFTLHPECGDIYTPSERHVSYTLPRGSCYAVAIYPTLGAVYAFLWPSAIFYLSAIAIYWMPHSPINVQLGDLVTYYNTAFPLDTSRTVAFASSYVQLLFIGIFGSMLLISGSSSATSEVK